MREARGLGVAQGVADHLLVGRKADCAGVVRGARGTHEGGPAQVRDRADRLPRREAVGEGHQGPLRVAVQQQIGPGIRHDGAADLVGPVVVVGHAAQARLDPAEHDGHVREGLPAALGVDDHGPVRPAPRLAAGRVGVVAAQPPVGRVAVHHGVHVARGDAVEESRPAQGPEGLWAVPVRLGDDPDPESLGLEQPPDEGHAEARVVHVRVARHQDHVALLPAEGVHLRAGHGQVRRGTQALGPESGIGEEVAGRGQRRRSSQAGKGGATSPGARGARRPRGFWSRPSCTTGAGDLKGERRDRRTGIGARGERAAGSGLSCPASEAPPRGAAKGNPT